MAPAHIPAWQRLGLKLKKPAESPPYDSSTLEADATSRKRKSPSPGSSNTPIKPSKKAKKDVMETAPTTSFNGISAQSNGSHSAKPAQLGSDDSSSNDKANRRKSVTFSSDTKTEDGAGSKILIRKTSVSRLARKSGISEQEIEALAATGDWFDEKRPHTAVLKPTKNMSTQRRNKSLQTQLANIQAEDIDGADDENENVKDKTRIAVEKNTSVEHGKAHLPIARRATLVKYLTEYHSARESWKFNKARQVALLKAVFDIDTVPESCDPALRAYLEGLQGIGPRKRLKEEAEKILANEKPDQNDSVQIPQSKEMSPKSLRARLVLESIQNVESAAQTGSAKGEATEPAASPSSSTSTLLPASTSSTPASLDRTLAHSNGIQNQTESSPARKKRKRRRARKKRVQSDDENTSSSSSSDDDSDSDDGARLISPATNGNTKTLSSNGRMDSK
jgi:hypothetical protein